MISNVSLIYYRGWEGFITNAFICITISENEGEYQKSKTHAMSLGSQWFNQAVRVLFQTTGFMYFQIPLLNTAAYCCAFLSISSDVFIRVHISAAEEFSIKCSVSLIIKRQCLHLDYVCFQIWNCS